MVSRLAKWLQEALTAVQYSEAKLKKILENHDQCVFKTIMYLVTYDTTCKEYIDRYFLKPNYSFNATNILISMYSNCVSYRKKDFIISLIDKSIYDACELCDQLLLNQLLDHSILNRRYDLMILLINKGAVFDKLTLDHEVVVKLRPRLFIALAKSLDQNILYSLLESIWKQSKYVFIPLLVEIPSLKDQKLFQLAVDLNSYLGVKLFLQDGFDPYSIMINDNTSPQLVKLIDKYKEWRL